MADIAPIPLPQGEQIWVLLRTDRDGASQEEVANSVGDFFRWVLREAPEGGSDILEKVSTGPHEWRVGGARPIELMSIDRVRPTAIAGKTIAARETYPGEGIPTVRGEQPWWLVVRFWWRPKSTTLQWPSLQAYLGSLTGSNVARDTIDQTDWVLDRAIVPTAKTKDPGDATWGQTQTKRVEEAAAGVIGTGGKILGGVAVLGAIYLFVRSRMRR